MKQDHYWEEAHRAGRERLLTAAACFSDPGHDDCNEDCTKVYAAFCGCETCVVRETLHASYPYLESHFFYKHLEKMIVGGMLCFAAGVLFLSTVTAMFAR